MARFVKFLIDKGSPDPLYPCDGILTIIEIRIYNKENVNVALFKPVKVSSFYGSDNKHTIVDGKNNDRWATAEHTGNNPMGKEWVLIDLQKDYYITRIELFTFTGNGGFGILTDYRIMFSKDDKKYGLAAQVQVKNSPTMRTDTITSLKDTGGYLYLKDNTVYGMQPIQ